ncbi:hypothetical protein KP509_03G027000 [Ceratopteris richardii]|uniref:K Homology domain-containing protein n=1 Tax=Ceratopteris richardii TaxID=49495 RepID=A0A8T2V9X0_CERRI|nr:hypothetical protein KP509_03G027000 [Ceratopteris richardii]KAH7441149.1 hypothetical protein KP509_03G027000 [Ceratopteris richardii]
MESSCPTYRGKHNDEREYEDYNFRRKRHMTGDSCSGGILPVPVPGFRLGSHGETVFRIVCPESRVGCVIGKGGSIIKSLRAETGAKIMIADAAEGADERVIFISSVDGDKHRSKCSRDDTDAGKPRAESEKKEKEEFSSSAQEALVKIHAHIVDGGDLKGEEDSSQSIVTRLLVPNSQVGCLLGRGGKVIEKMREDTNTRIRILPRDQLPFCSFPFDEILQIVGDASAVKKAVRAVAQRLHDNPAREYIPFTSSAPSRAAGSRTFSPEDMHIPSRTVLPSRNIFDAQRNADMHHQRYFQSFADEERGNASNSQDVRTEVPDITRPARGIKDEFVFRLLCPNEKIGAIIGKGGSIIRSLQEDIGVRIKVLDPVMGSPERVIMISSVECTNDDISPAQEALLHLQSKIADLGPDDDAVITSRLLVPSDLVGCLLGKGGSVITEIRRLTRANIRILGRDDLPKCALANDELVQIAGDIRVAREALIQVTNRLRNRSFEERVSSSVGDIMNASMGRTITPVKNEFGSPARLELPRADIDRLPSSCYQASTLAWMGQVNRATFDVDKLDVLRGGSLRDLETKVMQQGSDLRLTGALVTRTTIEVVIPAHAISAIIGDGGSRIVRIRQISSAKVDLLDVRSGASEGVVKISGTPEQTESAKKLLQELILTGTSTHDYSRKLFST